MREMLVNLVGLFVRYALPVIGFYFLARMAVMLFLPVVPEVHGTLSLVLTGVAVFGWMKKD